MIKAVALSLLFVAIFLFVTPLQYAQDTVIETDTPVGVDMEATKSSEIAPQKVSYELPFPGILPDSPLYIFKVLRDGAVKLVINNDMTRARFYLLNAEKRMFAAKLLVDKHKDDLAVTTFSKSNNYLFDALFALKNFKKGHPKSPDIKPYLRQFEAASLKHIEIATEIGPRVDNDVKAGFDKEVKRLKSIQKEGSQLLHIAK